jgi:hypothetical protein
MKRDFLVLQQSKVRFHEFNLHRLRPGQLSGVTDPSMGWGGGGLYAQVFTINVGCMYVRPTPRAALLMARVGLALFTALFCSKSTTFHVIDDSQYVPCSQSQSDTRE